MAVSRWGGLLLADAASVPLLCREDRDAGEARPGIFDTGLGLSGNHARTMYNQKLWGIVFSVNYPSVDPCRSLTITRIFLELTAPDCYGVSHSGHWLPLCVLNFDNPIVDMGE